MLQRRCVNNHKRNRNIMMLAVTGMPYGEIADRYGIGRVRVRQIAMREIGRITGKRYVRLAS